MNADRDEPSDPLARRARAEFDAACAGLDVATANRLRLARRMALARPARATWPPLVPIAIALGVAIAAVVTWRE